MFCSQCGTKNTDEAKFCKQCGYPLKKIVKEEEPIVVEAEAVSSEVEPETTELEPIVNEAKPIIVEPEPTIEETQVAYAETKTVTETSESVNEVNDNLVEENPAIVDSDSKSETDEKIEKDEKPEAVAKQVNNMTSAEPKKNSKTIAIVIGIIFAVAIIIGVILAVVLGSSNTINLNKYMTLESTGYEGYGTVHATIDWEAIEKKYGKKLQYSKAAKEEYGEFLNWFTPVGALEESVSLNFDNNKYLSNGDTVAYTWDIDEDLDTYFNCKIKYKDGTHKVSGLESIGTFDAFADLVVEFEGIAPNGKLNMVYNGYELNVGSFQADKYTNLKNGDVVTISINEAYLERYAQELGKIPAVLKMEYTVSGLESYALSRNEITETALQQMKQQAEDVFQADFAKRYGDTTESLESLTCIGDYFLSPKGDRQNAVNNYFYLVYKVQVHNTYENRNDFYDKVNEYFWFVQYSDLMISKDGSVNLDITDYGIPGRSVSFDSKINAGWWSTKTWRYYGYESLEALCNDVIIIKLDYYNHEDNIDESVAPKTVEQILPAEGKDTQDDYILPNSDKELISVSDLEKLTEQEIKIARNEIYARHGRKFKDDTLREYFESKDWYHGTINPDDFQESDLTDIEIKNKDIIVAFEKSKGYNR